MFSGWLEDSNNIGQGQKAQLSNQNPCPYDMPLEKSSALNTWLADSF